MKLQISNLPSGQPVLGIIAECKEEKQYLRSFATGPENPLSAAHREAIRRGYAGSGNPCGSDSGIEGTQSLHFHVMLGADNTSGRAEEVRRLLKKATELASGL